MTYPIVDSVFTHQHALEWLTEIAILNGRLFILLAFALIFIRFFNGSAAKRHFVIVLAFVAAILLPIITQWIPPIEIVVEIDRSVHSADAIPQSIVELNKNTVQNKSISSQQQTFLYWLFLYLSISAFFILQIIRSNLAMVRLLGHSSQDGLDDWNWQLRECTQLLNLHTNISIHHNNSISSPLTWGFFRSYILVPTTALNWNEDMKRSALLHELAHIKRRDCLSKQFARIVCAIYWINPLCWLALRQCSHYAESASDDLALNSGIKLSHYAENLLNVAKQVNRLQKRWALAAMSMVGFPIEKLNQHKKSSQLHLRMSAILNPHGCRAPINWNCVCITFLFVFGLLLPITSFKAKLVEQYNYVLTNPGIQIKPKKQNIVFDSPIEKDLGLNAIEKQTEIQQQIQAVLKQGIKSTPATPPLPKFEYREVPASVVLENAKLKVQQALTKTRTENYLSLKSDKGDIKAPRQTNALAITNRSETKANVDMDVVEAFDLAGIMGTHEAMDHLSNNTIDAKAVLSEIEPYVPQLIVTPSYPRRAQSRGIEGELLVEFDIDSGGRVRAAKIIEAQPSGVFDRAVLKAIQKNRYTPQKIDGKAVAVSGVQEKYVFVLET